MFEDIEKQTGGQITADEMRKRFRVYLIIFAIASTVLAIAVWSIWKQLV